MIPVAAPASSTGVAELEREFGEWRRVDPRSLLIYAVPLLFVGVWFVLPAMASGSTSSGDRIAAAVEGLILPLVGVAAVVVRYLTGRYAIVDGALRWKVGLLVHKATDIGLDRIQDVEVTRPLLARIVGLAALNVSSAGGAGEIKLQYLDHQVAERLGHHLQHLIAIERNAAAAQGYSTAPTVGAAPAGTPVPAVPLHRVQTPELLTWAAYRLWPVIPVLVAAGVVAVAVDWKAILAVAPAVPFILIGWVKPLADRVNLTVSIDGTSLFTSEGLTTVRRTSTQRERVQLVYAYQLWLQRLRGAETVRYASADVTIDRKEGAVREELALNVPADTWGTMAATVAHRQVIGPAWLRSKPTGAARATTVRWALGGLGVGIFAAAMIAALLGLPDEVTIPVVPVAIAAFVSGPLAGAAFGTVRGARRLAVEGWAVNAEDLLLRNGILRRTTLLLFAEKTQAIDVVSGPLQRWLGLVTVVVDVAPPGRANSVVIRDVTVAEAEELRTSLAASGSIPLPNGV